MSNKPGGDYEEVAANYLAGVFMTVYALYPDLGKLKNYPERYAIFSTKEGKWKLSPQSTKKRDREITRRFHRFDKLEEALNKDDGRKMIPRSFYELRRELKGKFADYIIQAGLIHEDASNISSELREFLGDHKLGRQSAACYLAVEHLVEKDFSKLLELESLEELEDVATLREILRIIGAEKNTAISSEKRRENLVEQLLRNGDFRVVLESPFFFLLLSEHLLPDPVEKSAVIRNQDVQLSTLFYPKSGRFTVTYRAAVQNGREHKATMEIQIAEQSRSNLFIFLTLFEKAAREAKEKNWILPKLVVLDLNRLILLAYRDRENQDNLFLLGVERHYSQLQQDRGDVEPEDEEEDEEVNDNETPEETLIRGFKKLGRKRTERYVEVNMDAEFRKEMLGLVQIPLAS